MRLGHVIGVVLRVDLLDLVKAMEALKDGRYLNIALVWLVDNNEYNKFISDSELVQI